MKRRFGVSTLLAATGVLAALILAAPVSASPVTISGFFDTSLAMPGDSAVLPGGGGTTRAHSRGAAVSNILRLTPNIPDQAGGAWSRQRIDPSQDWSTQFTFLIGGNEAADGLAFLVQNDPQQGGALSMGGSSLGYEGISPSVAVEFDTFTFGAGSPGEDPTDPHVATIINGDPIGGHREEFTPPYSLTGDPINAWIDYDASATELHVFVSDTAVKPSSPQITDTIDIGEVIGADALVGFTGATGAATESNFILNWSFTGEGEMGDACEVVGSNAVDTIAADPAGQVICTFGGNDVIDGGGGNDTIVAGDGNDHVDGGAGDDHIEGGERTDTLIGGDDSDDIGGGLGNDLVRYPGRHAPLLIDLSSQNFFGEGDVGGLDGSGGDNIRGDVDDANGASGADTIKGNSRNNILHGKDKADTLIGREKRDLMYGDGGYDFLDGVTDDNSAPDVLNCGANRGQADSQAEDTVTNCDPPGPPV
jgi:hypothetical protein